MNPSACIRASSTFLALLLAVTGALFDGRASAGPAPRAGSLGKPNIIYILADDLGYGDVRCLNPAGKIATPNIDRLASGGMLFTDAHSSSAVCTPTRYGIQTGRYNWRSRLQTGVLGGYSRPLIEPGRMTVPALLKTHGYRTACIGKWHLGMDWPLKGGGGGVADDGGEFNNGYADAWKVDYTRPIANGPLSVGYDSFFGISASLDMIPYLYIRNDRVVDAPTVDREFWPHRRGPAAENFQPADVLPRLVREAVAVIDSAAADARSGKPLFLYLALNAPHTPIAPGPQWRGKSGINPYADYVMETDWAAGQVLQALDRNGLSDNTLVIFTSDNGCSPSANFKELLAHGHNPSGPLRGNKADIFEGGHRVPFIARWPGKIKPGSTSGQTICLTDLLATCAQIVGSGLPPEAGEDSVSMIPTLLGGGGAAPRAVVHHSVNGSFAIRQGPWKIELCRDSGGWSEPRPGTKAAANLPPIQLYNLHEDLAERHNLQESNSPIVAQLAAVLERYVTQGRSTPGPSQPNTGQPNIWKFAPRPAQP